MSKQRGDDDLGDGPLAVAGLVRPAGQMSRLNRTRRERAQPRRTVVPATAQGALDWLVEGVFGAGEGLCGIEPGFLAGLDPAGQTSVSQPSIPLKLCDLPYRHALDRWRLQHRYPPPAASRAEMSPCSRRRS
jgi:hypothetical protein